jgi:hypothetical protein
MTGEKLQYTTPRGTIVEEEIVAATDWATHPEARDLQVREVWFAMDRAVARVMVQAADEAGYELIDNEILAGLQLYRLTGEERYPAEVSRLVGYSADGPESFVLLAPSRGVPVADIAGKLLTADRRRFQAGLLTGVRWLGLAGVAHRCLGPRAVRWDEQSHTVHITGFVHATIFGAPRQVVGSPPWAAPEQRPQRATGQVGDRDDIWALGRLLFYVITGDEPADRDSLSAEPELAELLDGVFGPPEERPSCRELLVNRMGGKDPAVRPRPEDPALTEGRQRFWAQLNRRSGEDPEPGRERAQSGRRFRRRAFMFGLFGIVGVLVVLVVFRISG